MTVMELGEFFAISHGYARKGKRVPTVLGIITSR